MFDERNLVEITSPAYPGERLVVCRNPLLAAERARKRADLLGATEARLAPIVARVAAGRLAGAARIGLAVGRLIDRYKMAKHFRLEITDEALTVIRDEAAIAAEAALDGLYVLRTSVGEERLAAPEVVRAYKRLTRVERAFRAFKGADIAIHPIRHWTEPRVRAHVLLCMLAYYVQWHMERAWAPLLFRDEEPPELADPVAPAQRSAAAVRKARTGRLADGTPAHSFRTLLAELATLTRDRVAPAGVPEAAFEITATRPPSRRGPSPCSSSRPPACSQNPTRSPCSAEHAHALELRPSRRQRRHREVGSEGSPREAPTQEFTAHEARLRGPASIAWRSP